MKKFAIDLRVRVGYGTAFLLLLVSYLLTLYANSEVLKQARLVDHSIRSSFIYKVWYPPLKMPRQD